MDKRAEAYVDTSALIAFADRADRWHALFARLFTDPPRLITTPLVVTAGHGWFLKRFDETKALHFLAMVAAIPPLEVIPTRLNELGAVTELLRRFRNQNLTLVDTLGLQSVDVRCVMTGWPIDRRLGPLENEALVIYR